MMPNPNVLLVDDNPLFRALASRTLEEAGYTVRAIDPESAFEVMKVCLEFKPDLAIID